MTADHWIDLPAGRFHYLAWGEPGAPVLVLLHGFNQTAHSWTEFGPVAGASYHVLALTQRGHGDSARSASGDYGREAMVKDAADFAAALGVERMRVVGMSMGATHAIGLAAAAPDAVERLVVVDYAPEVQSIGVDKIKMMLVRRWPSMDAAVAEVRMFNPRRSEDNIRERLGHTLRLGEDGQWAWKVDPAFALQERFGQPSEVMWDLVRRVSCPTLLVRGARSDLLTEQVAERMVEELRSGSYATVEDAGHSVAGDNPEGFAAAVAGFLAARGHSPMSQ